LEEEVLAVEAAGAGAAEAVPGEDFNKAVA
jgi:hypothetical protein